MVPHLQIIQYHLVNSAQLFCKLSTVCCCNRIASKVKAQGCYSKKKISKMETVLKMKNGCDLLSRHLKGAALNLLLYYTGGQHNLDVIGEGSKDLRLSRIRGKRGSKIAYVSSE